jgi:hypothetical protein
MPGVGDDVGVRIDNGDGLCFRICRIRGKRGGPAKEESGKESSAHNASSFPLRHAIQFFLEPFNGRTL